MNIAFHGLPSDRVAAAKASGKDAYGLDIERHRAEGDAYPCRHCLGETPTGQTYLILAWKPFDRTNPYTETGPIFLCAGECQPARPAARIPQILRSEHYLIRGYSPEERIVYGTGKVVPTPAIPDYAAGLLRDKGIAFADVRSASNNCYQCRILRQS